LYAAAAYLKDLHEKFGEWFLAAAARVESTGSRRSSNHELIVSPYWSAVPRMNCQGPKA
jgi:hypothetical protein